MCSISTQVSVIQERPYKRGNYYKRLKEARKKYENCKIQQQRPIRKFCLDMMAGAHYPSPPFFPGHSDYRLRVCLGNAAYNHVVTVCMYKTISFTVHFDKLATLTQRL